MVADNDAIHGTAFTVSVDYRHGTTTGISAEDRTATIRDLANSNAGRADFVRPGHIFPLIAKDGGVLMRSGHTEAAIDLCRLADDRAGGGDLRAGQRRRHGDARAAGRRLCQEAHAEADLGRRPDRLPPGAREARDPGRRVQGRRPSSASSTGYAYVTPFDKVHHYAFVYGKIGDGRNVPTRLHRANVVEDVFGGAKPIHAALSRFKKAGRGVLVYLRDGTSGVPTSAIGEESTASEHGAQPAMARDRARRADPARPRHLVDPALRDPLAHLCRARRVRHRDRRHRAARHSSD